MDTNIRNTIRSAFGSFGGSAIRLGLNGQDLRMFGSPLRLKDGKSYKILVKSTGNVELTNPVSFEVEYDLRYSFGDNSFVATENYIYKKDDNTV